MCIANTHLNRFREHVISVVTSCVMDPGFWLRLQALHIQHSPLRLTCGTKASLRQDHNPPLRAKRFSRSPSESELGAVVAPETPPPPLVAPLLRPQSAISPRLRPAAQPHPALLNDTEETLSDPHNVRPVQSAYTSPRQAAPLTDFVDNLRILFVLKLQARVSADHKLFWSRQVFKRRK